MSESINESMPVGLGFDSSQGIENKQEPSRQNRSRNRAKANATGARTFGEKRRSKYNALKDGIFAGEGFLFDEERQLYSSLLKGFIEYWRPEGVFEGVLVEKLAMFTVRGRRCPRGETAAISQAVRCGPFDRYLARKSQEWDLLHSGKSTGGMLMDLSNPLVIQDAIEILTVCREALEKRGFERGKNSWLLKKLYGLDADGTPSGLYGTYQAFAKLAAEPSKTSAAGTSPDELKTEMLEIFNAETKQLRRLAPIVKYDFFRKNKLQASAALLPSEDVLNRVVRGEAHISREFERTLGQLDRAQRLRLGKPVPPRLVVDINAR